MKRAVLALLLAAPLALAQENDAKKKLPIHPLDGAQEGDWAVLRCVFKAPNRVTRTVQSYMVAKVTDTAIIQSQTLAGEGTSTVKLPVKEAPDLETFFDIYNDQVSEVAFSDEKKTVSGREFACKKITFVSANGGKPVHMTAWLSTEVKGSGIVCLLAETDDPKGKIVLSFELAGFGSRGKTEWGKTGEEVAAELKAAKEK
jgi:hypothetical protein